MFLKYQNKIDKKDFSKLFFLFVDNNINLDVFNALSEFESHI